MIKMLDIVVSLYSRDNVGSLQMKGCCATLNGLSQRNVQTGKAENVISTRKKHNMKGRAQTR